MRLPKRFQKRRNGEWIKPKMRGFLWKCCNCDSVHRLNFRVNGKGNVEFQAFTALDAALKEHNER